MTRCWHTTYIPVPLPCRWRQIHLRIIVDMAQKDQLFIINTDSAVWHWLTNVSLISCCLNCACTLDFSSCVTWWGDIAFRQTAHFRHAFDITEYAAVPRSSHIKVFSHLNLLTWIILVIKPRTVIITETNTAYSDAVSWENERLLFAVICYILWTMCKAVCIWTACTDYATSGCPLNVSSSRQKPSIRKNTKSFP